MLSKIVITSEQVKSLFKKSSQCLSNTRSSESWAHYRELLKLVQAWPTQHLIYWSLGNMLCVFAVQSFIYVLAQTQHFSSSKSAVRHLLSLWKSEGYIWTIWNHFTNERVAELAVSQEGATNAAKGRETKHTQYWKKHFSLLPSSQATSLNAWTKSLSTTAIIRAHPKLNYQKPFWSSACGFLY